MADFGGGVPGQIVSELTSIPKAVVKDTAKAAADIARGTAETLVSATPTTGQLTGHGEGKVQEAGQGANDPVAILHQQKEAAAKKRLAEVRAELQEYFEKSKKEEEQKEMLKEQEKQEEEQVKKSKKKQEEQEVLGRLSRQYGGTGEMVKGGN